jgi:hypothetical protein
MTPQGGTRIPSFIAFTLSTGYDVIGALVPLRCLLGTIRKSVEANQHERRRSGLVFRANQSGTKNYECGGKWVGVDARETNSVPHEKQPVVHQKGN